MSIGQLPSAVTFCTCQFIIFFPPQLAPLCPVMTFISFNSIQALLTNPSRQNLGLTWLFSPLIIVFVGSCLADYQILCVVLHCTQPYMQRSQYV
ncbi:hypothetical protein BGZ63DRAFT_79032 [Mariannaea sp. PMI_226]|nr:hypothetical protein BGZ63DRAFT_79032 [Mariannaea sp. PMI_226]